MGNFLRFLDRKPASQKEVSKEKDLPIRSESRNLSKNEQSSVKINELNSDSFYCPEILTNLVVPNEIPSKITDPLKDPLNFRGGMIEELPFQSELVVNGKELCDSHVKITRTLKRIKNNINQYVYLRKIGSGLSSEVIECENRETKTKCVCKHYFIYFILLRQ
jgi:hypothetical protein